MAKRQRVRNGNSNSILTPIESSNNTLPSPHRQYPAFPVHPAPCNIHPPMVRMTLPCRRRIVRHRGDALRPDVRPLADVPFVIYGAAFMICASISYYHLKRGDIAQHKQWSVRTFSVGFRSSSTGSWSHRSMQGGENKPEDRDAQFII
ncbi:hypothetical protein BC938DRAFT_477700 [Jimgerdemannia flammicorona]|uniref:Uncharacterized protein n=1 Tax=Jimgerdemannia flammicorona TaxID=994334 RepID=A0A433QP14_9FUNG|nr:hypothetical protein BC938DRAFT_477700 [Jimgerdemannia flammicorona]